MTPRGDRYLLLCGERRFLAAQKLELPTIPALIRDMITQKDEILAFQLTENLQGILAYIQAKHPDLSASSETQAGKNYDVAGVMSELVNIQRRPEDVSEEIAFTVNAISEISGKSIRTRSRTISLLKLS